MLKGSPCFYSKVGLYFYSYQCEMMFTHQFQITSLQCEKQLLPIF